MFFFVVTLQLYEGFVIQSHVISERDFLPLFQDSMSLCQLTLHYWSTSKPENATYSPKARYDLFSPEVSKYHRIVSYMKLTQKPETSFLLIMQIDPKHEILLQSEVPPLPTTSRTEKVHEYQALPAPVPILNIKCVNTIRTTIKH